MAHVDPKDLDINNLDHVAHIINEIEGQENIRRKQDAWVAFQTNAGNQRHYVKEELKKLYPETHGKFRVGDVSLVKKINSKLSRSYKSTPMRGLDNDIETEKLQEIYDRDKFHRAFKEGDEIFNLHKYLAMWPKWINPNEERGVEGHYSLQALAPYEYDLIRDDVTGEPLIFILSYPDSDITLDVGTNDGVEQSITENQADTSAQTKKYSLWSAKHHTQILRRTVQGDNGPTTQLTRLSIVNNEQNVNPIGMLPVAFLSRDLSVDYPITNNIAKQSIDWNVSLSDLKTAAATQGHGQLLLKHPEKQKMKQMHMGMHTAMSLPQSSKEGAPPTTAEYISANPDLAGQLEVLKFDAINIADEHGLKSKGGIEGGVESFASGVDRWLSMADVQEIISDNQSLYQDSVEQGVYQIVKATEDSLNRRTFSSDKLDVTYEKPKPMVTDIDILDVIQKKLDLGVIEEHEKLMILNPNLSEEDAKEKLARIKVENAARMKEMQAQLSVVPQPEEDEEPAIEA